MYSFEPSDEQKMLIDTVSRYASTDLRARAREAEEEGVLPLNLIEKGWELGFLQASVPEDYGGFGERSVVTGVLALEEMAYGDLAGTLAVMAPGLFVLPVLIVGSEEQKQELIPPAIESDWKPYTAALLEPFFDFDPNELRTIAEADGDSYILTGEKAYAPFADQAKAMIVYANLDGRTQGFILRNMDGVEIGGRQKLLGINGLPVFCLKLNGVRVPKADRLGGADGHEFDPILDASRVATSALALGVSRAALEYARDYAKERDVFGVKVAQKQAIAFMLAEMATEIEAIRLLTWEAAWMLDQGKSEASKQAASKQAASKQAASKQAASKQAYLAVTGATDMAMMVTDRAVQVLGGHGYIREHPVEMWMRNGRGIATLTGLAMV